MLHNFHMLNLDQYRASPVERERVADLFSLLGTGERVLDIGTRDGFLARQMTAQFSEVMALDLEMPKISGERITCVQGDVTALQFPDDSFDAVLCAEVLEHIPPALLPKACAEIARVTRGVAVIGVPYRQDTRLGRLDCAACGHRNPPWGHVNTFDEARLRELFQPNLCWKQHHFVSQNRSVTNSLSVALMDAAGNPWGDYSQEEPCVRCGASFVAPPPGGWKARLFCAIAGKLNSLQQRVTSPRPNWIHVLFEKRT